MESETLIEAAIRVLNTSDPNEKARLGDSIAVKWLQRSIAEPYDPTVDLRPGQAGSSHQRAVSFDPFFNFIYFRNDWDENWHFDKTVGEVGVAEFDAEAGKSRLGGLDVLPMTISRFRKGSDKETADLLETVVYPEDITHCAAGVKWFKYLRARSKHPEFTINSKESDDSSEEIINKFHSVVREHFRGLLKPPLMQKQERLLALVLNGSPGHNNLPKQEKPNQTEIFGFWPNSYS